MPDSPANGFQNRRRILYTRPRYSEGRGEHPSRPVLRFAVHARRLLRRHKGVYHTQKQHNHQWIVCMEGTHTQAHRLVDGFLPRILQEREFGGAILCRQEDDGMADTAEKRGQNKDGSNVQWNMAQSVQHDRQIGDLCPTLRQSCTLPNQESITFWF